jgi:pimeloyl-ACP methyl ester carboxylesterase
VDGRRVAFRVEGFGRPIVLIPGLGNSMNSFDDVARDLGKTHTVILYDRAGYGDSEPRPGPHDAAAAERELAGVLAGSGVNGPYVLIGHSLGGLYAEYFAARHPEQVSALILAESRPSGFTARCMGAGQSDCVPPAWALWLSPKAARQEANALGRTAAQVQAAQPLQGKPVLVLSKAVGGGANAFDMLWANEQRILAARYQDSRHFVAPVSSHDIHNDARDWFVTSVRAFMAKTGGWR